MSMYQSYLANRKIQDGVAARAEFVGMLITFGIPFKSESGGITPKDVRIAESNFVDSLVKFMRDERNYGSPKIAAALMIAKISFDFDGENFAEQTPSVSPCEKRPSPQDSPPKRIKKHTVQLYPFEYYKDPESKNVVGSIMNDYSDKYSIRVNASNEKVDGFDQNIQIIFSDHPIFPVIEGAIRVGILDNDEPVPKFMENAGCYIYLRYDYQNTIFVNSDDELKKFGKLLLLSSSMSKNMMPDQVISMRKQQQQD